VKYLLFFITTILVLSCEQSNESNNFNEDDVFINHQIIINNPQNAGGSFFLYSSAGHNYTINLPDSTNNLNGAFGTPLKNWDKNSLNYIVMFYYENSVGFGCINVEINTFKDFELYHTNNFVVGEAANNSFCAWNENSFQYEILIND
jgi:hypothetical protein